MTTQSVQVKLELGHKASLRKKLTSEGFTHDWVVFVRGPEGSNIQHFVEKVVFHLHESFPKPKRVVKEPPYSVAESGYGSFNLPIEIYFKTKEEPRKIRFDYDLFLHLNGSPPVNHLRCEKLTFQNPTEDFRRKLIKAGGVGILGPNEFPGVPPSTQATTTPGTPQTSESKAFVELFGSSAHSESAEKSSEVKDSEQMHVKKKKSSHSKDRDKDKEKHKSKSSSATSSSVTNSPLMLSSPQSTPKTMSSPLTSTEKSAKHKHSSRRDDSEHSVHKKKKKDKDREKSKDRERTKHKGKHHDRSKEKEGDKGNEEHAKDKHHSVTHDKEKRRDKGGKTITCLKVDAAVKDLENKDKSKEKDRSKHKDGSSSRSKGHKRQHRSKERDKVKESSQNEKDSRNHESPNTKRPKAASPLAPAPNKPQLPPMSDIFSASDSDPFEDDAAADNAAPPQRHSETGEPDRSQKFLKSLFDEMSSDMEMSDTEDVDIKCAELEPLFNDSHDSPAKSVEQCSPPQIEPAISNGFSPREGASAGRPHLSPEKKQSDVPFMSKSPPSSWRFSEKSTSQKEHSITKWKEQECESARKSQELSPRDGSTMDDILKGRDESHAQEASPLWAGGQNTILLNKSNHMSPPRLSMDPPDLLKTTQHGDLLQFEAAHHRFPTLKREGAVDRGSSPNNNVLGKESAGDDLPEPVLKPGYAPNGETFELLLSLQAKLNTTKDEETLSDVVRILEESSEVFAITDASLDFDLCYLNSETVHKLRHCLHLS